MNTQCVLTAPKLFGSLMTDVSLLAVSISSTDARYALPINAVQFLKTAGLRIWNSIVVYPLKESSRQGSAPRSFQWAFSMHSNRVHLVPLKMLSSVFVQRSINQ